MRTVGPEDGLSRHVDTWVLFAAALLLWLLNHPYQGVWYDGFIYGLLAARWLHPEALAPDLFFRFGSQSGLSLFTPLYGELVRWLGLQWAAWWVVLAGGLAWVAAVIALARNLLGTGFAARLGIFLGAVAIASYAPNSGTFLIGENFATARSLAIPCGLGSLAALAAGRQGWAFGLSLAAAALHPLLGIWPLALWILMRLPNLAAVAVVLVPAVLAVLIGLIEPDWPSLHLMRGHWLAFAREAPDILLKAPAQSRLPEYAGVLVALWLGARAGEVAARPLYLRALFLGIGGLCLALLASYVFPLEILVQSQPWRVMALLLPLAVVALIDVGQSACRLSRNGPLLMAAAGTAVMLGQAVWLPALYLLGIAPGLPAVLWQQLDSRLARWSGPLSIAIGIIWLLSLRGIVADWDIGGRTLLHPWWEGIEWLHGVIAGSSWYAAGALAALPLLWRKPLPGFAALAALGCLALALAWLLPQWDRRSDNRRGEESCYLSTHCPPPPFQALIAPGQTVFWPGRELTLWFELHRASYYGEIQRTGVVFSRAKFDEWMRRDARVAAGENPRYLCGDPLLDWLVLKAPMAQAEPRATMYGGLLYACSDFRAVPPAPAFHSRP